MHIGCYSVGRIESTGLGKALIWFASIKDLFRIYVGVHDNYTCRDLFLQIPFAKSVYHLIAPNFGLGFAIGKLGIYFSTPYFFLPYAFLVNSF